MECLQHTLVKITQTVQRVNSFQTNSCRAWSDPLLQSSEHTPNNTWLANFILKYLHFPNPQLDHGQLVGYTSLF